MQAYNHLWQINNHKFKEVAEPKGIINGFLHLIKNNVEYRMPKGFIVLYVPTNKFFIEINKVSKYMERVNNEINR